MGLIIDIDFFISLGLRPYRDGLSLNLTRAAIYSIDGSKLNEGENKIPKLLNMTLTWPDLRANGSDGIDVSYGLWIEQFLTLPTPLSLFRNHTENTSTAHQSKSLLVGSGYVLELFSRWNLSKSLFKVLSPRSSFGMYLLIRDKENWCSIKLWWKLTVT